MSGRRALTAAVLGCVAVGVLLVIAAGRPWLVLHLHGQVEQVQRVSGRRLEAMPYALGWLAAAGGLALLALRGMARRAVAAILAVAGVIAAVASLQRVHAEFGWFSYAAVTGVTTEHTAWPWVSGGAGVLLVAVAVWVFLRGPSWPGMGQKYDAPGAHPARPEDPEVAAWDALDRGEDPTA